MLKNKRILISLITIVLVCGGLLAGCGLPNFLDNKLGNLMEDLVGRNAIVQTYDEDSNIIDRIKGKSISISSDDKFAQKDDKGKVTSKSDVISLTIGGKSMVHVGSSLIAYETGLKNLYDVYAKKVNIQNNDRSVPFVNKMVNNMKNLTTGKSKIILIRSQTGKPLATFAGDNVSYFATDINKSTGIIIDDKYLFIYRCDYTIYDKALLR